MQKHTHIGTLEILPNGAKVCIGGHSDLTLWANRPGQRWPRSELATIAPGDLVVATFDSQGDLVDLTGDPEDLSGDELTAWTDDLKALA